MALFFVHLTAEAAYLVCRHSGQRWREREKLLLWGSWCVTASLKGTGLTAKDTLVVAETFDFTATLNIRVDRVGGCGENV